MEPKYFEKVVRTDKEISIGQCVKTVAIGTDIHFAVMPCEELPRKHHSLLAKHSFSNRAPVLQMSEYKEPKCNRDDTTITTAGVHHTYRTSK